MRRAVDAGARVGDPGQMARMLHLGNTAYLIDGTLVDQVQDQPFKIDLSTRATVGLADGMLGMRVGGQRLIVAPSEFGQGACPSPDGTIPGNSTLIYKVDLLAID